MASLTPSELVARLRSYRLRVRTGIWLLPLPFLAHVGDEAARLDIDLVDIRQVLLNALPKDTIYSGLDAAYLVDLLDEICRAHLGRDCILVYNFDLLLARLRHDERMDLWHQLYDSFPYRRRALLIAVPQGADALLPSSALGAWRQDGRLVETSYT